MHLNFAYSYVPYRCSILSPPPPCDCFTLCSRSQLVQGSSVPRICFGGGSTNSAEDRGQRERESGGGRPLVRGFTQFANERNPYSDEVVTDVYSTELGIWPSFFKTAEFRVGGGEPPQTPLPWVRQCRRPLEK
jgi:hypothetical protein